MATILVEQSIKLEEIIIEALIKAGAGSQNIHGIKELLNGINAANYNGSLHYSKKEFYHALERLVQDGFHRENLCYHLYMRIHPRLLGKPSVRFWLSISEDKLFESVSISTPQKTDSEPEQHLVAV